MNNSSRILLVEDEVALREMIKLNLESEGYDVDTADSGPKAIEMVYSRRFDLIILDIMLPEMDGFQVCTIIRLEGIKTPVLFLTAKDAAPDRVKGLKTGGDDYMAKPFNLEELLLRIAKLIQRSQPLDKANSEDTLTFGDNTIDFRSHSAINFDRVSLSLSKREVMLLRLFALKKNEVISREEILESVWGYDVYPTTRTIDNFILNFRKYFEKDVKSAKHFHSVRGVGYRFTPE